uniref:Geranyl diphosphate synthase n=1 Tax=Catharanthus roseus TaxID=4058 RepID=T1RNC9_CATRO|nr:geranyl diphosphate synthase [Catharanthus roseus]
MAKAISSFINGGRTTFLSISRSDLSPTTPPHRPNSVICMKSNSWANIESDIQTHLKKSIPIRAPEDVFEPMHYLTFAAPRTTAPALCIAACEVVGGDGDQAMAAAAAIHLVHAAAYAHENLPLTDRRRPKPPIQHKFNSNIELLTGDGIVPYGFELLAKSMDSNNSDRILRVIIEITQAAGSKGIIDGQFRELDVIDSEINMGLIEYVCKKKEGELNACGAACGAILGGGSEEEIGKLRKFGLYAGMIQGLVHGVGKNREEIQELVRKLRYLAMEELKSLKNRKIDTISSLLETDLCSV